MEVSHIIIPFMLVSSLLGGIKGEYKEATASWYGKWHFERLTASGETYNKNCLTFAHQTMRFGTKVKFTYKGKTVIAYCNDRGDFEKYGRKFDLSYQVAKRLGFLKVGVDKVKYKIIIENKGGGSKRIKFVKMSI